MNKKVLFIFVLLFCITRGLNLYRLNTNNYLPIGDDESDYLHLATSIAKTGKYGHLQLNGKTIHFFYNTNLAQNKDFKFLVHDAWRPPLWPVIIASILKITNYNLLFIHLFKYILEILTFIVFFKITSLLNIHKKFGYLATGLLIVHPALLLYNKTLLTEPISLSFLLFFCYALLLYLKHKNIKNLLYTGLMGSVVIINHPVLLFFPFTLLFFLFIKNYITIKNSFILFSLFLLLPSFWIIRNQIVYKTNKIIITTSSSSSLTKGWNSNVISDFTNTKGDLLDDKYEAKKYGIYKKNLSELEKMDMYKEAAILFLKDNVKLIPKIITRKITSALNPIAETPKLGILEKGRQLFHVFYLISLLLLFKYNSNKKLNILILAMYCSTLFMTVITYTGFRFRMPLIGLETLLFVFILQNVTKTVLQRKKL